MNLVAANLELVNTKGRNFAAFDDFQESGGRELRARGFQ